MKGYIENGMTGEEAGKRNSDAITLSKKPLHHSGPPEQHQLRCWVL